ncbi:hypothetical protein A1F94_003002 [Pyrenophora tritici-repentis]|uniref:Uncharacterized protein n=2 Tax=Pyrenophora tritici-repentis TaxID=45151 RepID=A0A2W1GHG1_9PLEO|nr:hypothetical protein PtrV1_04210 [Pyrenophora tritici-repentis]KAF7451894.1 hypothetical protein A1F99_036710 [Pyrenophora tritici-repentis]KAG9386252.1 hypothetical protein A1F94_003002 [Pyrenophora tritici-repentis]KAI0581513.1 hypothetical protein Alg130_06564 [Pyrenophora tritici-repentis]KAI0589960.1 hypothetical protein Alg215_00083 [Pyrenophora tritici-repentis]
MASDDKSVYLGVWTDWSHGSVKGLTYTTTLQKGGLLVAFLALFVTFTGTCFWSIISFTMHQMLSRQAPQNATYHQRQAILRNSGTSGAAAWKLFMLTWAWRKTSLGASMKASWLSLTVSLITFCAFAAAGIFSSQVATSRGGQVLLVGDKCASYNISLLTPENQGSFQSWVASSIRSSSNYESSCYSGNASTYSCNNFVQKKLPFTSTSGIPCPFPGKNMCKAPNQGLRMDTGYLDSHDDLGMNAPPSDRFLYRAFYDCAPVNIEPYLKWNKTGWLWTSRTFLGTDVQGCGRVKGCSQQYTYNLADGYHLGSYKLRTNAFNDGQGDNDPSSWQPIPELQVPNADIGAFWLEQHGIWYFSSVKDPWFAAESSSNKSTPIGPRKYYDAGEKVVNTLVCAQQYQFCNPSKELCTAPMGSSTAATSAASNLFTNTTNEDRFMWNLRAVFNQIGFSEIAKTLKEGALLASDFTNPLGQFGLPDNQWELELKHWFGIMLAALQGSIVNQASGPSIPEAATFHSLPTTAGERAACTNQKIRSDSYTSFNVLGLILIFSIGGLIMLISACLPSLMARIQRKKPFASIEWDANDTLQLQRLAHEAVGAGNWEGTRDDYPRTQRGDLLAVLDTSDPKHPKLKVPPKVESLSDEEQGPTQVEESIHSSLLSVEIPRVSMELSQRFSGRMD